MNSDIGLDDVFEYIDANKQYFLEELRPLLEQKSISTRGEGVHECATLLVNMLNKYGLSNVRIFETPGSPIVFGEVIEDPTLPTILMYGHYDVQPPEPLEEWNTDPFKMVIKNERIYCRGSSDNKAQFFAALMGMVSYRRVRGKLPINMKYLLEGEEEIGSIHLPEFARQYKDMLKADACIYSDGCYHESGRPVLILGLKGTKYAQITLHGANRDTHSMRSSCIPNPIWRLPKLLSSIRDEDSGYVKIKGFYDDVRPLTQLEIDAVNKIPVDEEALKHSYGINSFVSYPANGGYYYNLMFEPAVNVAGIFGGYTGGGFKTVLPSTVTVRLDFRLVPNQKASDIQQKLLKHLKENGFGDAEVIFEEGSFDASRTPIDNCYVDICAKAVEDGFGEIPIIFPGVGGGGPNCIFMDILGMPAIEIPFADTNQFNHAPNESQVLSGFYNGIKTSAAVIARFKRL